MNSPSLVSCQFLIIVYLNLRSQVDGDLISGKKIWEISSSGNTVRRVPFPLLRLIAIYVVLKQFISEERKIVTYNDIVVDTVKLLNSIICFTLKNKKVLEVKKLDFKRAVPKRKCHTGTAAFIYAGGVKLSYSLPME